MIGLAIQTFLCGRNEGLSYHYHISAEQNRAVDSVRWAEHKQLMAQGDATLKGTRYQWAWFRISEH